MPAYTAMLIYTVVVRRAVRRGELNERNSVIPIRRVALWLVLGVVLLTILSKQKPDAYNALEVAVAALAVPIAVAYAVRELRRAGWLLATRDLFKKTSGNPQLLAWMVNRFCNMSPLDYHVNLIGSDDVKAARIHQFGSPDVIVVDDVPCPTPGHGEVIVRVAAAGVGPWDALIRTGKATVNSPLPLILGAELSGAVTIAGPSVAEFRTGDEVYGATNKQFYGAYAEYALASTATLAPKPGLRNVEAASVPVVGVTAWQMLFDYGQVQSGQTILIHGAAGNVGAYAVQLASRAGLHVFATASARDREYVTGLGAARVIDYRQERFEEVVPPVDVVIDTVGGETRERSYSMLKPGGILVSAVTPFPETGRHPGVREAFFIVDVTTARLSTLATLFDSGKLAPTVGTILPLDQAREAHKMLGGAPHKRGKIVLSIAD